MVKSENIGFDTTQNKKNKLPINKSKSFIDEENPGDNKMVFEEKEEKD